MGPIIVAIHLIAVKYVISAETMTGLFRADAKNYQIIIKFIRKINLIL